MEHNLVYYRLHLPFCSLGSSTGRPADAAGGLAWNLQTPTHPDAAVGASRGGADLPPTIAAFCSRPQPWPPFGGSLACLEHEHDPGGRLGGRARCGTAFLWMSADRCEVLCTILVVGTLSTTRFLLMCINIFPSDPLSTRVRTQILVLGGCQRWGQNRASPSARPPRSFRGL